jgi:hypothetical protein
METVRVEIINPKAKKLLKDLEDLKLIRITNENYKSDFSALLQKIRAKSIEEIALDEITKEVEEVRKVRYEN